MPTSTGVRRAEKYGTARNRTRNSRGGNVFRRVLWLCLLRGYVLETQDACRDEYEKQKVAKPAQGFCT